MKEVTKRVFIENATRDQLLEQLLTSAEGVVEPKYVGSIAIPQAVWDIAEHVGHIRNISNEELRSHGKARAYHRGDKQLRYAVVGSVGDVLLSNLFYKHQDVLRAPLADVGPSKDLDLVHLPTGCRIDVKTSESDYFNINHASHHSKPAETYLLLQLVSDDLADMFVCSYASVHTEWKLYKARYNDSQFYSRKRSAGMEPLAPTDNGLEELAA